HLLRAQADVKRREVMRQQAGSGGQNRASEDLSNLFDKELARQQQTNYETPTTTEQRESEDSDLDAVRELARRQDEALRRQQELQRQMQSAQPDERRRAMGDMQLEARQLADEQRAIAAEQGKASGGEQGNDARRRLAAEQERLADRMRRLQNGLETQASAPQESRRGGRHASAKAVSTTGQTRNAAREASREIERQRLPERM